MNTLENSTVSVINASVDQMQKMVRKAQANSINKKFAQLKTQLICLQDKLIVSSTYQKVCKYHQ
jgi:hypothetical protein